MNNKVKSSVLNKVRELPLNPGVYLYKDIEDNIIYVGKAKSLRNRVKSYFQDNLDPSSKTFALVSKINDISYVEVLSEFEALILEAELIKIHHPKYNINLKDDKSYLYVVVQDEFVMVEGKNVKLPKITLARKNDIKNNDIAYGPYPDSTTARYIIRTIRKIFPYRDCSMSKFARYRKLNRPCLYGHLGLCHAPCTFASQEEYSQKLDLYRKSLRNVKDLLSGKSISLLEDMKKTMVIMSKEQNYEEAMKIRNLLSKFNYVRQNFQTAQTYIENPYLVEDIIDKSLTELQRGVSIIGNLHRIECYDISNISGKEAVGSMTVAIDGRISKSDYRKFKVKTKDEPDDFSMMQEVLSRRLKHIDSDSVEEEKWETPDLIVIDGGKGQVSAVLEIIDAMKIDIPVIGLAKKFETIVYKDSKEFVEINLGLENEGLKLLQRLRDEAHRFAKKYHHQLRLKKIQG